jgi:uncharacterized membrane protein
MQCPVCHNEVGSQSTFCNHCGAPLAAAAPGAVPPQAPYTQTPAYTQAPPSYTAPPQGYPQTPPAAASSGLSANSAAAIAYITFIPAILFLVIEPYNKTPLVRFHSFQSIGLAIVWFALWFVVMVLSMFFAFIPGLHLLFFFFPLLHFGIFIVMFILWLMAILKASKGEFYKLPIIGDFAMKQAQS